MEWLEGLKVVQLATTDFRRPDHHATGVLAVAPSSRCRPVADACMGLGRGAQSESAAALDKLGPCTEPRALWQLYRCT